MRLITRATISTFCLGHPNARAAFADWCDTIEGGRWESFADLQRAFGNRATQLDANRVKFKVHGKDYRIIVSVRWAGGTYNGIVKVEFVGTHAEYNRIDARTVTWKS